MVQVKINDLVENARNYLKNKCYSENNEIAYETLVNDIFANEQTLCFGAYFISEYSDVSIWVGYWAKHGYCVSFHSEKSDAEIENILKLSQYDYHVDYIEYRKETWYSIELFSPYENKHPEKKNVDDLSQNENNFLILVETLVMTLEEENTFTN